MRNLKCIFLMPAKIQIGTAAEVLYKKDVEAFLLPQLFYELAERKIVRLHPEEKLTAQEVGELLRDRTLTTLVKNGIG